MKRLQVTVSIMTYSESLKLLEQQLGAYWPILQVSDENLSIRLEFLFFFKKKKKTKSIDSTDIPTGGDHNADTALARYT